MKDVLVDADGELRCPDCGGKNLDLRRTTKAKVGGWVTIGIGVLALPKRVHCLACGTSAKTGNAQPSAGVKPARPTQAQPSRWEKTAAAKPNSDAWFGGMSPEQRAAARAAPGEPSVNRAQQGLIAIGAGIAICLATWGLWAYNKARWEDDEAVREAQDMFADVLGSSAGPVSGGSFNSAPYVVAAIVGAFIALAGVIIYAGSSAQGAAHSGGSAKKEAGAE